MNTERGISNEQFKFIFELLTNNFIQLNKEKCDKLRLNFYTPKGIRDGGTDKYPIRVKIG